MTLDDKHVAAADPAVPFPPQPRDVTVEWLTHVLRSNDVLGPETTVAGVRFDSLSEGVGMMGTVSRLHLDYEGPDEGPRSLILKSASEAPKSRQVAATVHLYEREVHFYRSLGPALEPSVPHAFFAEYNSETVDYAILMEDFAGYRTGDQVVGADAEQARHAIAALARFHAQYWDRVDDPTLSWVPSTNSPEIRDFMIDACVAGWDTMVELFEDAIPDELKAAKELYLSRLPALYKAMSDGHQTLTHTDYRADNLLFAAEAAHRPIVILDWSAVAKSKGVQDLAFFLTQNLSDECRAHHEQELHALYYETLVKEGVDNYSFEEFDRDYELGVLFNFVYAIVIASALDISNERATAFVGKLASRSADCIVGRGLHSTVLPTLPTL